MGRSHLSPNPTIQASNTFGRRKRPRGHTNPTNRHSERRVPPFLSEGLGYLGSLLAGLASEEALLTGYGDPV